MATEREYVQRRNASRRRYGGVTSSGRSVHGSRNYRRKSGPPPFLVAMVVLILLAVIGVIFWAVAGRGGDKDKQKDNPSSADSTVSTVSQDPVGSTSDHLESGDPAGNDVTPEPVSADPATPPPEKVPEGNAEQLGALLKVGDTGFEYYNFVESFAQRYISTVCDAGDDLKGVATVYDMIIPTSMDITLPESYIVEHDINSSDQNKAINYMMESIAYNNPSVVNVPLFEPLKLHNNEYIYFRTDHHWTQLGAYYAYEAFCKAKGISPAPLSDFDKRSFGGYLGTFYNSTPNDDMAANPDTVEAYYPRMDITMEFTDTDGNTLEWPVIADGDDYSSSLLYLIFAAGDQPYEKIVNHDIHDGSTCIVLKESFGNAFVPFLACSYETVYVIDYRYYSGDVVQLAKDTGATDVILLNNISMTRNEGLIDDLDSLF